MTMEKNAMLNDDELDMVTGGSVSSLSVSICSSSMHGVSPDKVDAIIARRKERNPQMDVIWMN